MSRKTLAAKAVVVAGAVAATTLFVGNASAEVVTVTKAAPGKVALGVSTPVAIAGTGFTSAIAKVQFGADPDCVTNGVVITSPTLLWTNSATHADCVAGAQTIKLLKSDDSVVATLASTVASKTVTFVAPAGVSAAAVDHSTGVAGTRLTFTGLTGLAAPALSATLGGKALGSVKWVSASSFTGVVPAGLPAGDAPLVVTSGGVVSEEKAGLFTSKLAIKVSPNVFQAGTTAPAVKIEGTGLKPSSTAAVTVTVCGVPATVASAAGGTGAQAVKAPTANALYVTAPSFTAAAAGTTDGKVDATGGGVCIVRVTVDPEHDTTSTTDDDGVTTRTHDSDDYTSVVTATAGLVYAAY